MSGFVAVADWRWCFWIGFICSAVSLPLLACMPETYAPIILKQRAREIRRATGDRSAISPWELEDRDVKRVTWVAISRPLRMIIHESIVTLTLLYLALAYGIFYLSFETYPVIFQGRSGRAFATRDANRVGQGYTR